MSNTFNVIQGDKDLMRKVGMLEDIKLERIMRKRAEEVRAVAIYLVPVGTDPGGELRSSIHHTIAHEDGRIQGVVYTNKKYGPYVEFGTGPVGQANHSGIDPDVNISYRQDSWVYKDKKTGNFYRTSGQPARPFMYPALKNSEKNIIRGFREDVEKEIQKVTRT